MVRVVVDKQVVVGPEVEDQENLDKEITEVLLFCPAEIMPVEAEVGPGRPANRHPPQKQEMVALELIYHLHLAHPLGYLDGLPRVGVEEQGPALTPPGRAVPEGVVMALI